jgi:hypothetical protein
MGRQFWFVLIGGMVVVLGVAFWVIRRNAGTVEEPAPAVVAAPAQSAAVPAEPGESSPAPAPPVAVETPPAPAPARKKNELLDIADPLEAIEIVQLRRGPGDTIEIGARNRSRRGLLVKSVDLFAESDERTPLCNIGFWLPVGGYVEDRHEVAELSRRLGEKDRIKAVINDAEFRDTPPEDLGN